MLLRGIPLISLDCIMRFTPLKARAKITSADCHIQRDQWHIMIVSLVEKVTACFHVISKLQENNEDAKKIVYPERLSNAFPVCASHATTPELCSTYIH